MIDPLPEVPSAYSGEALQKKRSRRKVITLMGISAFAGGIGIAVSNRDKAIELARSARSFRYSLEDWIKSRSTPRHLPNSEEYAAYLKTLDLRYITEEEVIRPHHNVRQGVANEIPPKHMWKRISPTLKIADRIRHELGTKLVCINSAYRSPAYNAVCSGAASRSYHMKNCALDLIFSCPPKEAAAMAKKLRDSGAFKGGIGTYSGFIHIDTRGHNATWEV